MPGRSADECVNAIDFAVRRVAERGWTQRDFEFDDFATLRKDRRFLEAQVAQLYEEYFVPERHEVEWGVLREIAGAVVASPATAFVASAVAGGVVGNAAYDLVKHLCRQAAKKWRTILGSGASERGTGFSRIAADTEKLKTFFSGAGRARIPEIESGTGVPREKLYPLMKLAGLRHQRRGDPCWWEMPPTK